MEQSGAITQLLAAVRRGDRSATDRLFSIVYQDLRQLAHRKRSGRQPAHTLNTTALVHEVYLKMVDRSRVRPEDRQHFFATAARAMRQILIDYARTRRAAKRGGDDRRVSTRRSEDVVDAAKARASDRWAEILDVDSALGRLSRLNERLTRVVELRFFAGFSIEESAEILDVSPRTVKRDWQTARAFLYRELEQARRG
jgi:RNA polymerase sigma factor (TIGR02999 family)